MGKAVSAGVEEGPPLALAATDVTGMEATRATAGLRLMIHHFAQAAMLEVDALIRQHPVGPALQLAAHRDIGRVGAVIVDAGVSLGIDPDAQVGLSRTGDKDAQVGGKQHIGIFADG